MAKIKQYRADIDGLRAIAVLAVILFHFDAQLLPNGFLGVDVFFVISGYVVTSSLVGKPYRAWGQFLKDFLARRFKRLLPALLACTIFTMLLAFMVIPKTAPLLDTTIRTGLAGLFGFSNVFLLHRAADYFGSQSELNLFTHTWSLGVEEQFYLIFPLLFILSYRLSQGDLQRKLLQVVATLSVLSLGLYFYFYQDNFQASFYLMPARFWELGAGCLSFLAMDRFQIKEKSSLIGEGLSWAAFLGLAVALLGWPGMPAYLAVLLTVISTCGLLLSLPYSNLLNSFLTLRPMIATGLLSYSLYLWHWPIIAVRRWVLGESLLVTFVQALAILSLAMASYHLIEKRFRHRQWAKTSGKTIALGLACSLSMVLVFRGGSFFLRDHLYLGSLANGKIPRCEKSESPNTVIIGDSHGGAIEPAIALITQGDCLRLEGQGQGIFATEYAGHNQVVDKPSRKVILHDGSKLIQDLKGIEHQNLVIAHYWQGYFSPESYAYPSSDWVVESRQWQGEDKLSYLEGLEKAMSGIQQVAEAFPESSITILLPFPDFDWVSGGGPPRGLCQREWFRPRPEDLDSCRKYVVPSQVSIQMVERRRQHIVKALRAVASPFHHVRIYDPVPRLCQGGLCSTHDQNGLAIYRDDDHINVDGGRLLGNILGG